jgi:hypothetical protein
MPELATASECGTDVVAATPLTSPGTPPQVEPLTPSSSEVTEVASPGHCCSCQKTVDQENSLVIVRQNSKTSEVRRCRSCRNVRAAIARLQKKHGALVSDWTQLPGETVQQFYQQHSGLRGDALRAKIETVVQDWQVCSTRFEFTSVGEYLDEVDLRKKYADRPDTAEMILKNGRKYFCQVKQVWVYSDPKYEAKVADVEERGTSHKRKAQILHTDEADKQAEQQQGQTQEGQKGEKKQKPVKISVAQKKKMQKKMDAVQTKKLQVLDSISKCSAFGDMIPGYVVQAAQAAVNNVIKLQTAVEKQLDVDSSACASTVCQDQGLDLDAVTEDLGLAAARLKTQLDQAAAFK